MSRTLRILVNIARYDYGQKERGNSFEYDTFYRFFQQQGYQVQLFDYASYFQVGGTALVDKKIRQQLTRRHFDLIFTLPTTHQFSIATLDSLKQKQSGALSVAWMADDKWRWSSYSQFLAPHFDRVITTDPQAVAKYRSLGCRHAILSQWAVHPSIFHRLPHTQKKIDVVFIGGFSAWRDYVIQALRAKGIKVECYGTGWPNGRLTVKETVHKYNQARIVLNLSNSAQAYLPFLLCLKKPIWCGSLKKSLAHFLPGLVEFISTPKRQEDIKARFFEATGCGAFLLTYSVAYLEKYLKPNLDCVIYHSLDDLIAKIIYYLNHQLEREKIAQHGYRTTHTRHTYQQRFQRIFKQLGI